MFQIKFKDSNGISTFHSAKYTDARLQADLLFTEDKVTAKIYENGVICNYKPRLVNTITLKPI